MLDKFQENLKEAIKTLQIADHIAYVTFPLVNEKKLLLKIFDETYKSIMNSINAVLNYEYLYNRIKIYENTRDNLDTFIRKCAKRYDISNEQIKKIREVIDTHKKHKSSAMEFVRNDKIVLMSDDLGIKFLDIRLVKIYLLLAKELLMKVNNKINK